MPCARHCEKPSTDHSDIKDLFPCGARPGIFTCDIYMRLDVYWNSFCFIAGPDGILPTRKQHKHTPHNQAGRPGLDSASWLPEDAMDFVLDIAS